MLGKLTCCAVFLLASSACVSWAESVEQVTIVSSPGEEVDIGKDEDNDLKMAGSNLTYVYLNGSDPEHGTLVNTTEHEGFLHGFVESLTVILVSEVGDKTFFIAAIMAMTANKLTVFLGAISALALMTVLSALLGFVITSFIPRIYTYYACTAIMFLFGLKMLWEAWRMKPDEAAEIQAEVTSELQRRGSIASGLNSSGAADPEAIREAQEVPLNDMREDGTVIAAVAEGAEGAEVADDAEVKAKKPKKRVQIRENSVFGKKCYRIFKVFVNCFTMTFLAEWGDRSQLATIVLASINDVFGVCVGGVLGHTICTGVAVIAGALVGRWISVRVVTFIGALVFLGFAIASLFFDPETEEVIKIDI